MSKKVLAVVVVLCAAVMILASGATAAAKTLNVSATDLHVGDTLNANGCGYKPGQLVFVYVYRNVDGSLYPGNTFKAGLNGCFSGPVSTFVELGDFTLALYVDHGPVGATMGVRNAMFTIQLHVT